MIFKFFNYIVEGSLPREHDKLVETSKLSSSIIVN